jgi:hypothetical protein
MADFVARRLCVCRGVGSYQVYPGHSCRVPGYHWSVRRCTRCRCTPYSGCSNQHRCWESCRTSERCVFVDRALRHDSLFCLMPDGSIRPSWQCCQRHKHFTLGCGTADAKVEYVRPIDERRHSRTLSAVEGDTQQKLSRRSFRQTIVICIFSIGITSMGCGLYSLMRAVDSLTLETTSKFGSHVPLWR